MRHAISKTMADVMDNGPIQDGDHRLYVCDAVHATVSSSCAVFFYTHGTPMTHKIVRSVSCGNIYRHRPWVNNTRNNRFVRKIT